MKHFLVFWAEDDHHELYGVFSSMDEFVESFSKESERMKDHLLSFFKIHEMQGKELIDVIYLDELADVLDSDPL